MFWHVIPTGGHLFEVGNGSEAFGVDEERRNCTCRLWPRKTPLAGSSLIDEDIDTPIVDEQVGFDVGGSSQFDLGVEEQASQFDVGVSSDVRGSKKNDVGGSAQFDVGGSSDVRGCSQFDVRIGRWFGLRGNDNESDPIENSEVAQETNHNATNDSFAATQETHHFSATTFDSTQNSQNH
ncbi:hypothetical protein Tco_0861570 [Tanacetum coccineum]|uniref:Uncharacterized protein n=1 Tax=Tanacetum coccineum TaxID=301880 RepID=A0ABQ5BJ08_9ASTR